MIRIRRLRSQQDVPSRGLPSLLTVISIAPWACTLLFGGCLSGSSWYLLAIDVIGHKGIALAGGYEGESEVFVLDGFKDPKFPFELFNLSLALPG